MSMKIPSTGLFVEAAYGQEGMPGLDGVTGQGESHEIAWKQALSDAASQLPVTSLSTATPADQMNMGNMSAGQESGAGLTTNMGGQENPISWDRLSMTVASMVAWNMSVGMADDVLAETIEATPVSELVPEEGILLSSVDLLDSDLDQVDSSLELVQEEFILAASLEVSLDVAELGDTDVDQQAAPDAELLNKQEFTAVSHIAEMDQGPTAEESVIFREGSEVNQPLEGMQSESTDTREVGSKHPMDARVGTTTGNAANSIMKGLGNTPDSEIPPTYLMGQTAPSKSADSVGSSVQTVAPLLNVPMEAGQDPLDAVIRVRSSSVVDPEVSAGKQRLEAIRQVLGQLENQAQVNEMAADVRDTPRGAQQFQSAALEGALRKGSTQTSTQNNDSKAKVGAGSQPQLNQNSSTTSVDNDVEDTRTFGTVYEDGEDPESLNRPILAKPKSSNADSLRGPVRGQSTGNIEAPTTQAGLSAEIAGSENAEIAADELTMLEGIEFDAENIDANEVPELIIQDPSQIDVDIDDAAGTVRLEMTRDGEEISIRMETPQEVLDSYREMESEMGGALADRGLDLSEFTAEANDADGEDLDENGRKGQKEESRQGRSDTGTVGAQELEQTGDDARLVNHIV